MKKVILIALLLIASIGVSQTYGPPQTVIDLVEALQGTQLRECPDDYWTGLDDLSPYKLIDTYCISDTIWFDLGRTMISLVMDSYRTVMPWTETEENDTYEAFWYGGDESYFLIFNVVGEYEGFVGIVHLDSSAIN